MIAHRSIFFISCLLLSACASHSLINEASLNPSPSPAPEITAQTTHRENSSLPTKPNNKTQTENSINQKVAIAIEDKSLRENKKGHKTTLSAVENIKQGKVTSANAAKISSWDISGAMAARNKNKGWSASVNWVQRGPSQYQIRLSGPLGSGTVIISRNGGAVTLRDGPKTVTSSSAESLLKQQTGVSLPVANLYYWARGIPAPGSVSGVQRDPTGQLMTLRQAGYTIQFLQYTSAGGALLPSSLRLQGNGIFIKLIIRNWRV